MASRRAARATASGWCWPRATVSRRVAEVSGVGRPSRARRRPVAASRGSLRLGRPTTGGGRAGHRRWQRAEDGGGGSAENGGGSVES
jgi:hypothetical protein